MLNDTGRASLPSLMSVMLGSVNIVHLVEWEMDRYQLSFSRNSKGRVHWLSFACVVPIGK